jgi:hypothetical protein
VTLEPNEKKKKNENEKRSLRRFIGSKSLRKKKKKDFIPTAVPTTPANEPAVASTTKEWATIS